MLSIMEREQLIDDWRREQGMSPPLTMRQSMERELATLRERVAQLEQELEAPLAPLAENPHAHS